MISCSRVIQHLIISLQQQLCIFAKDVKKISEDNAALLFITL